MPHTSKKKKYVRSKRVEIVDEDGWTRITSSGRHNPIPTKVSMSMGLIPYQAESDISQVPSDMTLEKAKTSYEKVEAKWLRSGAWNTLRGLLEKVVNKDTRVDCAVVFGTGSATGLTNGWIERHEVALYQLAVFKNMIRVIEEISGQHVPAYAQEPTYNELDMELLSSLGFSKIDTPKGFELLTKNSLAYSPGAELSVEMAIMLANPGLYLSHKLGTFWRNEKGQVCTDRVCIERKGKLVDAFKYAYSPNPELRALTLLTEEGLENDFRIFEGFLEDKVRNKLPDLLDVKDYPFHDQYLYWRTDSEEGREGKESTTG